MSPPGRSVKEDTDRVFRENREFLAKSTQRIKMEEKARLVVRDLTYTKYLYIQVSSSSQKNEKSRQEMTQKWIRMTRHSPFHADLTKIEDVRPLFHCQYP